MTFFSLNSPRSSQQHQFKKQASNLLHYEQTPSWMKDNEYLRSGYRPQQPTIASCVTSSLFTWSNDFVNIYSHLIGFLILLPVTIYLLTTATSAPFFQSFRTHVSNSTTATVSLPCLSSYADVRVLPISIPILQSEGISNTCYISQKDNSHEKYTERRKAEEKQINKLLQIHKLGLSPLLFAGLTCLLFSSIFHIFWVISPKAMDNLVKLDFLGITFLCIGHALSGTFYTFYCQPYSAARPFYTLLCGALVVVVPVILHPFFATAKARTVRTLTFGLLGGLAIFPLARATFFVNDYYDKIAFFSAVVSLMFYAFGGVIYASRFPECCRIGKHDRFFSSHQVMHVSVLLGIATHLIPLYYLFKIRVLHGCQNVPL